MKKTVIIMTVVFGGIGIILAIIAASVYSAVAKWILGILAVVFIGCAIIGDIASIMKEKRYKKDVADIFMQAINESTSNPDFSKRMQAASDRRDILFDGQRPDESDYGYSESNPIMTSTIPESDKYLGRLRTMDDHSFTWKRICSFCMSELYGVENVMIDMYQLFLEGQEYKTVYICPYGHSSSYVPQGLKLSE